MKEQKEIKFEFQEVPLEEAQNLVAAGSGNYAQVKAVLLDTLPKLSPDKAFAFGVPNGNPLDESTRKSLCLVLNSTLTKADIPWKVTYSGIKKLFVCVPTAEKLVRRRESFDVARGRHGKVSKATGLAERFVSFATNVFGYKGTYSEKPLTRKARSERIAICVVGVRDAGISPGALVPLLGLTYSGVNFNAKTAPLTAEEEIKQLRAAYKNGGF